MKKRLWNLAFRIFIKMDVHIEKGGMVKISVRQRFPRITKVLFR